MKRTLKPQITNASLSARILDNVTTLALLRSRSVPGPPNDPASKLTSRLHVPAATRRAACHASGVTPCKMELP